MRDDRTYLVHIFESIELVQEYLGGSQGSLDQRSFFEDQRTQDAVLRRLETLTDAASHLSNDLKHRYPQIPWRTITDFRNVMAHAYVDIRPERVWKTILEDLPQLKALAEAELQQMNLDDPTANPEG